MRSLVLLCTLLVIVHTSPTPNGYYKQEYQFKKTSSTYKNNQLETKNDDEGYYGKQGDLDGSAAPAVQQHNQHQEFISPTVDGVGHSLTTFNDRDLTPEAERAFRDYNIQPGTNRQVAYSSSAYHGAANLGSLTRNLQYDMEQQVRDALSTHRAQEAASSSYGATQMRSEDMQYLENQLRANITRQLQAALQQQYGQQATRGQSTHTGFNSQPNYDTNELNDLRQRMESDLLRKLHEGATSTYSQSSSSSSRSSSSSSSNTYRGGSGSRGYRDSAEIEDLNRHGMASRPTTSATISYRPVYRPTTTYDDDLQQRPERISYGQQNQHQQQSSASQTASYGSSSSQPRYPSSYGNYDRDFPTLTQSQIVVNPQRSVTDVLQTVQNEVTETVRKALRSYQEKYSAASYTLTNARPDYQRALDDFKRDLRYNLTRTINDELERNYGRQETRGEYSFSSNARTNANYRIADLDDLKQQVENNLLNYLETTFHTHETNYQRARAQSSYAQRDHTRHGPQHTQSLTADTAQNPDHVRYEPGAYPGRTGYSSQSSYSASSSWGSSSGAGGDNTQHVSPQLTQIRNQLRDDLNRQLQAAVYEQRTHAAHGSSSSSSNSQLEQLLTDELKTNLTRRLQETLNEHYGKQGVRGGQSYTISATGVYYPNANYRTEDLNAIRQQLQDDLERNLQTQLNQQKSYGSSSSQYSASSASSSSSGGGAYSSPRYTQGSYNANGGVKGGMQKYEQFGRYQSSAAAIGEDCV